MKKTIAPFLFLTIFISLLAQADFTQSLAKYKEKNFAEALEGFKQSASLGHKQSQLNLGAMYFRGEGVERSLVDAYAWFSIAAENGNAEAEKLKQIVAAKLTGDEFKVAEDKMLQLQALYGEKTLSEKLYPVYEKKRDYLADSQLGRDPNVPKALRNLKKFYFKIECDFSKKGFANNCELLKQVGVENADQLYQMMYQTRFKAKQEEKKRVDIFSAEYGFAFAHSRYQGEMDDTINADIREKFEADLDLDNTENIYQHVLALGFRPNTIEIQNAKNSFGLLAATMGHSKSQQIIGWCLIKGNGCNKDVAKGLRWLVESARANGPSELYYLGSSFYVGDLIPQDIPKAIYYLEKSANQQHKKSMMKLAWILATTKNNALLNPKRALELVQPIMDSYSDRVTAYETLAAAQAANGNFDAAIQTQKLAEEAAKKVYGREEEVALRLKTYQQKQIWQE